ncbi:hypothetical protein [Clostridium beijerinckii]|uniref:hypothetical protein n=1 Tax=Clostridium beijerinckii TaxID=1520 RepID=UPI001F28E41D|nr:hypothetical protein [Clostridium beijerinckii]
MNRISSKNIKQILSRLNLSGKTLSTNQIQNLIRNNYNLTQDDYLPYTCTRKTKYPFWISQVQRVLFHWSHSGVIIHHPNSVSYTF